MSGFVWLASYPKSGNTWLRAFLTSVLADGETIDINAMPAAQPSSRAILDEMFGIDTSDLTPDEILNARPAALAAEHARAGGAPFRKVHEAWIRTADGTPLFAEELTAASVYIVRDPRDVAISLAHHLGDTIDAMISFMADPKASLSGTRSAFRVHCKQPLLSWSGHFESWCDHAAPSPLLVRYEDMIDDPLAEGIRIARHIGLTKPRDIYEKAVAQSSFGALQRQEVSKSFVEVLAPGRRFFRSGKAGGWRAVLTPDQIAQIERAHAPAMRRLGYL